MTPSLFQALTSVGIQRENTWKNLCYVTQLRRCNRRVSWSVAARATCLGRANVFSLSRTIQTRWNQYWYSRPTTKTLQGRGYRYKQAYTQNSCNGKDIIDVKLTAFLTTSLRAGSTWDRALCCCSSCVSSSWNLLILTVTEGTVEKSKINWCLRHLEPEIPSAECNLVASFCRANFQSRNSNRYFIFFLVLVLTLELRLSEEWQGPLARVIASRLDITPSWVTERHWNDARFCLYFKRGCSGWAILPRRLVFFTPVHRAVI